MAKKGKNSSGCGCLLLVLAALAVLAVRGHAGDSGPSGDYVAPAEGKVTSGFGARWGTTHYGVDIANKTGTPIRAVANGTVIVAGPATGYGLWMQVRHPDETVTVYGHMNTIDRPRGSQVTAGEQIATIGARGESTGPHLHFEVWPHGQRAQRIDPVPWLADRNVRL